MIRVATKSLRRTAAAVASRTFLSSLPSSSSFSLISSRNLTQSSQVNTVTVEMINYALSLARSHKSDGLDSQAMLVLEQCLSAQSTPQAKGLVHLAMSTVLHERGDVEDAMNKLQTIQDSTDYALGVRVAALEGLVGLHLEKGQDDTSAVLADKWLQLFEEKGPLLALEDGFEVFQARVKALKGLIEVISGNLESAGSSFQGIQDSIGSSGSAGLSCGEYMHATQNFSSAKEFYEKLVQGQPMTTNSGEPLVLATCNMAPEMVFLAATCALGQLEMHLGNFDVAEELLTKALSKTEEHFGSNHQKVGVILLCIALMFRHKASLEHSSSLLIQEGLYRRAIDLLKAPPLETEGLEAHIQSSDIVVLARGERMKNWAEATWRNPRLSLAEALDFSKTGSKVPVVDLRISRVL
ncbi:hypothetical protein RJ641_024744 [Dillenia turbinata]|uniref:MalT-like TPR region domain-containing protein n=1 Tax=Dillenia turbinata TaxID=194707 RepID=A0AAN8W8I3_9MAGN